MEEERGGRRARPDGARQGIGGEGARVARTTPASIAPPGSGAENAAMEFGLLGFEIDIKARCAPRAISTLTSTGRIRGGALNF